MTPNVMAYFVGTRKVPGSNLETGYSDRDSPRFFTAPSGLQIRPRPLPSTASLSPLFPAVLSSTQSRTPDSYSMMCAFFSSWRRVLPLHHPRARRITQTDSKYQRWSLHLPRHTSPENKPTLSSNSAGIYLAVQSKCSYVCAYGEHRQAYTSTVPALEGGESLASSPSPFISTVPTACWVGPRGNPVASEKRQNNLREPSCRESSSLRRRVNSFVTGNRK